MHTQRKHHSVLWRRGSLNSTYLLSFTTDVFASVVASSPGIKQTNHVIMVLKLEGNMYSHTSSLILLKGTIWVLYFNISRVISMPQIHAFDVIPVNFNNAVQFPVLVQQFPANGSSKGKWMCLIFNLLNLSYRFKSVTNRPGNKPNFQQSLVELCIFDCWKLCDY